MTEGLLIFLRNPDYPDPHPYGLSSKLKYLFLLLFISLTMSILLGMVIGILDTFAGLNFGTHALEGLMEAYSPGFIMLAAVLLAPVMEEFLFRWPMRFFKGSPHFKIIFYAITLLFGFYHLLNYEITPTVLFFSPLLVAPQVVIGAILGFMRVRFGLLWAIILHASYNLILIGPILFFHPDQMPSV
jgi:hypothetical protein